MLEDFLPLVSKPARYINTEINSIHKDLSKVRTRICLFFPDTYEIGMSHLGLRILYDILNTRPDTACERVFSPWIDYEKRLRASGRPLKSLESGIPLIEFDIIGITLQYELSYTNIVIGLDLAHIPLHACDRTDDHPLIIAGGPCAVNPEPLSDFIDVFFIGEAEEAVHELIELKQKYSERPRFLSEAAKLDGFYVPAFGKTIVRRRYIKSIDSAPYPERPMLPLLKPVHDRVTAEVARGCIRGCRFCQAGVIYRPYRERSPERVTSILENSLACTGYDELSLASLSSGDYSEIQPLITGLMSRYRDSRVSISLPSLRVGTLSPEMVKAIAGTRKTGFTLAPEAGTERLRRVINKPVTDQDLLDAAETIFKNGWNVLKLYFMIGLPTETDEDLDGIIRLGTEILARARRSSKRRIQINISVSTFVPKPHTPFQWIGQAPLGEIRRKQAHLEKGLTKRGIALKPHHGETSLLEGAFARGDRSLGRVIEEAVRLGCCFDGWSECFDFRKWAAAFEKFGMNAADCASRSYALEEALPWDHVKSGVTKEFLQREYRRAADAQITENCRTECSHCGIGCQDGGTMSLGLPGTPSVRKAYEAPAVSKLEGVAELTKHIRIKYTKTGRLRFLSHLDFMSLFHRTLMRATVKIAFSRGFNPHPKTAFGPALPVGIESEAEYVDLECDAFVDAAGTAMALNNMLPEGVRILESRVIPGKAPSLSGSICRYDYRVHIPESNAASLNGIAERFLSRSSVIVTKEGRSNDIRTGIESVAAAENCAALLITLQDKDGVRPRIQDVIAQIFESSPDAAMLLRIRRTEMYYRSHDAWATPMDIQNG